MAYACDGCGIIEQVAELRKFKDGTVCCESCAGLFHLEWDDGEKV